MKKTDLLESVYSRISQESKITKSRLRKMVDSIFNYLQESLIKDEVIKISNFGSFKKVIRKEKKGKNFKTGTVCNIPQRFTVKFKISKKILQKKLELTKR